jgi:uncharacterized membrane protein YuzA (DUF378 family)
MELFILIFARLLLIIGGLNYFFIASINVNIFQYITNKFILQLVFLLIGISALWFAFNRDYYLPFLGPSVIPIGSNKTFEKTTQIQLTNLPPNTTVMVWGAQESDEIINNPYDAYGDYSNTVIAKTDFTGKVTVLLPCPAEYYVNKFGFNKKLKRHVHYRYEYPKYRGLFSRIFTKYINEC